MRQVVVVLVAGVLAFILTTGGLWYRYVTNTETPFDEVGVEINSRMPAPLRKWGCDQLKKNFGRGVPPMGCDAADGRGWL